MFYSYPFIEDDTSLLHEQISQLMENLRTTEQETFSPDLCPEDFAARLRRSPKLSELVSLFVNSVLSLREDREQVLEIFSNCNSIPELANDLNRAENLRMSDLPKAVQLPARILFIYLYESTIDLKSHYKKLYKEIEKKYQKYCPFCGLEILEAPERITPEGELKRSQQDYDHLLCKDLYFFAAVNMRNLAPMGEKCNRRYKKQKDVLFDSEGNRRPFFYAFSDSIPEIRIDLNGSPIPNDEDDGEKWKIDFRPRTPEVDTWADIFEMKERLRNDVFKTGVFTRWLSVFKYFTKRYSPIMKEAAIAAEVKLAMEEHLQDIQLEPMYIAHNKARVAVFDYIIQHAPPDYFEDLGADIVV